MSKVFVLDAEKRPLSPCTPARARLLLKQQKAAVLRHFPFTLILKEAKPAAVALPLRLKIDPGSQTTGIAVVNDVSGEVVWAAEITHRGDQVRKALTTRRGVRRSRRLRHTRYREPRYRNRRRPKGWLPPSLRSRVDNIQTWVARLTRYCPIGTLSFELVRFDTQLLQHPTIEGLMYQRGTLFGTELRHYLLAKWEHCCAYCQTTGVPLEIDHVVPQGRGGSDRVANLVITCRPCNQQKGDQSTQDFLADRPEVLARVQAQRKAPLKDAACCGASTPEQLRLLHVRPWFISASGRQRRQMCNVDKRGFPVGKPKGPSRVRGFRTGDLVKAICLPHLRAKGVHVGRVLVRTRGIFDLQTKHGLVKDIPARCCQSLQQADGYAYQLAAALPPHG